MNIIFIVIIFQVFGLLRQGDGKVIITASFEDKMQTIRLPAIETEESLWEFIEILFEELRCECFYEKGNSANNYNGSHTLPNGKASRYSIPSPSNFYTNLENEPLIGKLKRRISETGSETTSEENFESGPPSKKHQRPLMTTLSFNAPAATTTSSDKHKRLSREHDDFQRRPKLKKSKSPSSDHSKPRGRPPGLKIKDKYHGNGDLKYKSTKHKSKHYLESKFSNPTSNQSTGHERQTQPVSPSKRLPIYHNAHKLFQEHQLQKQQDLVASVEQQLNSNNMSNVNLPPPTLLPEVPTTPTTNQQKSSNPRHTSHLTTNHTSSKYVHNSNHQQFIDNNKPMEVPNLPKNPADWTVDQVVRHLSFLDPTLGPHVEMFRTHEIDGKALLLLKEEMMMKYMDMKLGPALKISNIVNLIQGKKHQALPK